MTRDPAERHDIWESPAADTACAKLAGDLKRLVAGLALPAGAAEKLARAVTPPGRPAPAPATTLEASLGSQIGVRGFAVSASDVRAGDALDVTYDFISHKPVAAGWRLLFHLDGPAGSRNVDHVPVDGLMPLERWRPGQRIRDQQRIPILAGTPPGVYTMYVGAFRGDRRLPVDPPSLSDGKDRLKLFSVVVR